MGIITSPNLGGVAKPHLKLSEEQKTDNSSYVAIDTLLVLQDQVSNIKDNHIYVSTYLIKLCSSKLFWRQITPFMAQ